MTSNRQFSILMMLGVVTFCAISIGVFRTTLLRVLESAGWSVARRDFQADVADWLRTGEIGFKEPLPGSVAFQLGVSSVWDWGPVASLVEREELASLIPALGIAVEHEDPRVRYRAVAALGHLAEISDRALHQLELALDSPHAGVRNSAGKQAPGRWITSKRNFTRHVAPRRCGSSCPRRREPFSIRIKVQQPEDDRSVNRRA